MTTRRGGLVLTALAGGLGLALAAAAPLGHARASEPVSEPASEPVAAAQDDQDGARLIALLDELSALAAQIDTQIIDLREALLAGPDDADLRALLERLEADRAALASLLAELHAAAGPAVPAEDP